MSGKLDQSLDDIVKTQRTNRRGRNGGRRSGPGGAARPAAAAPVGGVAKSARAPRGPRAPAAKPAPVVPASGDSKIIVSGLVRRLQAHHFANTITNYLHSPPMLLSSRSRYVEHSAHPFHGSRCCFCRASFTAHAYNGLPTLLQHQKTPYSSLSPTCMKWSRI